MKISEIKQLIREVIREGFQGDEPIGDGLSGFRGTDGNKDPEHEKKIDSLLSKLTKNSNKSNNKFQDFVKEVNNKFDLKGKKVSYRDWYKEYIWSEEDLDSYLDTFKDETIYNPFID